LALCNHLYFRSSLPAFMFFFLNSSFRSFGITWGQFPDGGGLLARPWVAGIGSETLTALKFHGLLFVSLCSGLQKNPLVRSRARAEPLPPCACAKPCCGDRSRFLSDPCGRRSSPRLYGTRTLPAHVRRWSPGNRSREQIPPLVFEALDKKVVLVQRSAAGGSFIGTDYPAKSRQSIEPPFGQLASVSGSPVAFLLLCPHPNWLVERTLPCRITPEKRGGFRSYVIGIYNGAEEIG